MILTEIGEIGVHVGDDVYILRPTLYAMSRLGEPAEIVELYAAVMTEQPTRATKWLQLRDALAVIHASSEDDLSGVFGYFNESLKYVMKRANPAHILPIARALLQHGITGALPEQESKGGDAEFSREFNAREYVAIAVAHLGATERDAWQMTMTGLVGALRAKFPKIDDANRPGGKAPSLEEHEQTMDWFEAVERKRKGR